MRQREVAFHVRNLRYKPGYVLVSDGITELAYVVLRFTVPDVQNPGETFQSSWRGPKFDCRTLVTVKDVHDKVYEAIHQFERHEILEFLRDKNGKPIWEPHPKNQFYGSVTPDDDIYSERRK